jgi:HAD superfamily hydrolase (TIGR01509 family)
MTLKSPLLIFDLGGVLVRHNNDLLYDWLAERCAVPAAARKDIAARLDDKDIGTGRLTIDALHTRLVGELGFKGSFAEFLELWSSHFSEEPGMEKVVKSLAGRHRTVIFSNTNAPHIAHIEARYPVYRHAHAAYLSYELGLVKPDPPAFLKVLELEDCEPQDCIFIDDRPENTAAAEMLGMTTVTFTGQEAFLAAIAAHGLAVKT